MMHEEDQVVLYWARDRCRWAAKIGRTGERVGIHGPPIQCPDRELLRELKYSGNAEVAAACEKRGWYVSRDEYAKQALADFHAQFPPATGWRKYRWREWSHLYYRFIHRHGIRVPHSTLVWSNRYQRSIHAVPRHWLVWVGALGVVIGWVTGR